MSEILIAGLRVKTHIGVPDEERAAEQDIEIDIRIQPMRGFLEMGDDLSRTIDYAQVSERVCSLAGARPRRLIETLAEEVAGLILAEFEARFVEVELRKFILPQTRHVAVRCSRSKS
jgi:FolB domain-containing protein